MPKKTIETNFPTPFSQQKYHQTTREEKINIVSEHVRGILEVFGFDLADESLSQTPERVAKMYVDEVFSGLNEKTFPKISLFNNSTHASDGSMIITKVKFVSFCEHHLVPMLGTAYVGYLPGKSIIGLSKISRLVRFFASRPQLQERLCAQIGSSLSHILGHNDIMVYINATHTCVIARGTKDESSSTVTTFAGGTFEENSARRSEFLAAIRTFDEKM